MSLFDKLGVSHLKHIHIGGKQDLSREVRTNLSSSALGTSEMLLSYILLSLGMCFCLREKIPSSFFHFY